jgi:Ca2+-binding RTX toxin-like protein
VATLIGTGGNDTLTGGVDNDLVAGSFGADSLVGGDGDDTIIGDATYSDNGSGIIVPLGGIMPSADTILAGAGNDWIVATGTDVVDGGTGTDTIDIDVSATFSSYNLDVSTLSASAAATLAFGGTFTDLEVFRFWLGSGNDTFVGSTGNDYVSGGSGSDSLSGGAGNDSLIGGGGFDTLRGGDGDDYLLGAQANTISITGLSAFTQAGFTPSILDGGAGNDRIAIYNFGGSAIGGDGEDTLVVSDSSPTPGIQLDLSTGDANAKVSTAFAITASGFERFAINGKDLSDSMIGTANADFFAGNAGNDTLIAGAGNDTLDGGTGNDLLFGGAGADSLVGRAGDDVLVGDNTVLELSTPGVGSGFPPPPPFPGSPPPPPIPPTIISVALGSTNTDIDTLLGGDGNDWIVSTGGDSIEGGTGSDTLDIDLSAATTARNFDLSTNAASSLTAALGGSITDIETFRLWLGSGNDTVVGSASGDVIAGGAGDDVLNGAGGNDTLYSGMGADSVLGGDGDDAIYQAQVVAIQTGNLFLIQPIIGSGTSSSTLDGGAGNDLVVVAATGTTALGGSGTDTLSLILAGSTPINLDMSANAGSAISTAFGITASDFESFKLSFSTANDTVIGSANADVFDGQSGSDSLDGQGGEDSLDGGGGNDTLLGGGGNDTLLGGFGNDVLTGGVGSDSFVVTFTAGESDTITDYVAGTDLLSLTGAIASIQNFLDLDADGQFDDALITGSGTVTLLNSTFGIINGTAGNDSILGLSLNETIYGLGGNDTIDGGVGNDVVDGGDGNDYLNGLTGADRLTGGLGNDTFVVGNSSLTTIITDYQVGMDSIVFPLFNSMTITNNVDLDGDGQLDDASATYGTGTVHLYNTTYGILNGTSGNDTISGNAAPETISGFAGNDVIDGGQGDDVIDGGDGNDIISGSFGNDRLTGGAGNDTFVVATDGRSTTITDFQEGADTIVVPSTSYRNIFNYQDLDSDGQLDDALVYYSGGTFKLLNSTYGIINGSANSDILSGTEFADTINGLAGNDRLRGLGENDQIFGGDGNDFIDGGIGSDAIFGGNGNDQIAGSGASGFTNSGTLSYFENLRDGFSDNLRGEAGDDRIVASNGDVVDGGTGTDTIEFDFNTMFIAGNLDLGNTSSVSFYLSNFGVTYSNVEVFRWWLGSSNDTVVGTTGADFVSGGAGNDTLGGGLGNDTLSGSTGADNISGGDGDDALYAGNVYTDRTGYGEYQDGTIFDTALDTINAGAGNDLVSFSLGDVADGGTGTDTAKVWLNGDNIARSINLGADLNTGLSTALGSAITNFEAVEITFSEGNDTFVGAATGDTIFGNGGNDSLSGNAGNDVLIGGAGNDFASGGLGNDLVYGNDGNDSLDGGDGDDLLTGDNGADTLAGGAGLDTLYGYLGNDILDGGDGVDYLDGGDGNDRLTGGAGGDAFTFVMVAGNDTITDYVSGEDFLEILNSDGVITLPRITSITNDTDLDSDGQLDDALIVYGGGTISMLNTRYSALDGAGGDDFIVGTSGNDLVRGFGGNDKLDGSSGDDTLLGGLGNDTLIGGLGSDSLVGGVGNDVYYLNAVGDFIVEQVGDGARDTAFTSISYSLGYGAQIEVLAASNSGSTLGLALTGNEFNNQVLATAGDDTLNGATGDDTLYGYGGNDYYYVDSATDVVVEAVGGGTDVVFASGSYSLAFTSEIEVLAASNAASTDALLMGGNEFNNQILAAGGNDALTGDAGNDTLYGFAGNDTLIGGTGADALVGGAGNDIYYVDSSFDVVLENASEGNDIVFSSVSFSASGSSEIEIIAAANQASNVGLYLGGNGVSNQLLATAGNDTLNGGAGSDALYGFGGDDVYYVDVAGDVVIEAANGGADIVFTNVSYTLAATSEVEILAAANSAGTTGIGLVGNSFDNQLLGTAGSDTLQGGAGTDTLYGLGGNDIYYIDTTSDIVVEAGGGGSDTIFTAVSYTLAGTSEVEILAAANAASTIGLTLGGNEFDNQVLATAGNDVLTGNAGNDTLWGFGGNDTMSGGLGNDVFVGGAGEDVFVLGEQFGGATFDTIVDYSVADDQINLNSAAFAGLGAGALSTDAFTIGTQATTLDHRIIYDDVTGDLLFDADGSGAGGASVFANIGVGLAMTVNEFLLV